LRFGVRSLLLAPHFATDETGEERHARNVRWPSTEAELPGGHFNERLPRQLRELLPGDAAFQQQSGYGLEQRPAARHHERLGR
jgi:hypothetical protein